MNEDNMVEITENDPVEFTQEVEHPGTDEEMIPVEANPDEENLLTAEDEPLSRSQIKELDNLLSTLGSQVQTLGSIFMDNMREYHLRDKELKALLAFNSQHVQLKPDNLTQEEEDEWDYMNGLLQITEDDVKEIFPEDNHPIYGGTFDITKDRIHEVMQEFFMWSEAKREYELNNNAYSMLIERDEEAMIAKEKAKLENETDPDKKAELQAAIDQYYDIKYLKYLRDDLPELQFKSIINSLSDADKVKSYLRRGKEIMNKLQIKLTFIPEIVKFEEKYMSDKYKDNQGVLLMYFLTFLAHAKINPNVYSINIAKATAFVTTIDKIVRGVTTNEETRNEVMLSLETLEDKFVGKCPSTSAAPEHKVTPPISEEEVI